MRDAYRFITFCCLFCMAGVLLLGAWTHVRAQEENGLAKSGRTAYPAGSEPDGKWTPGAILAVTKEDVCVPGYSKKVRNVPQAVKNQVYKEYGIRSRKPGQYEVDHLISLELGGSNALKNLWPESYLSQPWNAHVKDKLENRLHGEVCSGKISLAQAQKEIATDWIAAYRTRFPDPKAGGK